MGSCRWFLQATVNLALLAFSEWFTLTWQMYTMVFWRTKPGRYIQRYAFESAAERWEMYPHQKNSNMPLTATTQVWRIQPDGVFVENFAIRRRSPEELALIAKVRNHLLPHGAVAPASSLSPTLSMSGVFLISVRCLWGKNTRLECTTVGAFSGHPNERKTHRNANGMLRVCYTCFTRLTDRECPAWFDCISKHFYMPFFNIPLGVPSRAPTTVKG